MDIDVEVDMSDISQHPLAHNQIRQELRRLQEKQDKLWQIDRGHLIMLKLYQIYFIKLITRLRDISVWPVQHQPISSDQTMSGRSLL